MSETRYANTEFGVLVVLQTWHHSQKMCTQCWTWLQLPSCKTTQWKTEEEEAGGCCRHSLQSPRFTEVDTYYQGLLKVKGGRLLCRRSQRVSRRASQEPPRTSASSSHRGDVEDAIPQSSPGFVENSRRVFYFFPQPELVETHSSETDEPRYPAHQRTGDSLGAIYISIFTALQTTSSEWSKTHKTDATTTTATFHRKQTQPWRQPGDTAAAQLHVYLWTRG